MPPRGLIDAVHTQTEGNPLFVTETVRLLIQEGELGREDSSRSDSSWNIRIPEGVREVIGRRLDRLSERCNRVLTAASIIGRRFTLDQLKVIIEDTTEDQLLDVIDESLAARAIDELPSAVGEYEFSHALIQETLAEELSTTRRVRLHARIGEALEQLYGDQVDEHAAQLARHFAEAETVVGPEKLIGYSLIAAMEAISAYGWEDALAHCDRALAAAGEKVATPETAELSFGRAQALVALNRLPEAGPAVAAAFEFYEGAGEIERAVEIASHHFSTQSPSLAGDLLAVQRRAVELIDETSDAAGPLFSALGHSITSATGDYEESSKQFRKALELAERSGDHALQMRTFSYAVTADVRRGYLDRGLEKARRVIALAKDLEAPPAAWRAYVWGGIALMSKGRPDEAKDWARAAADIARQTRDERVALLASLVLNLVALRLGDWKAVTESGMSESLDEISRDWSKLFEAPVACQLGDFDRARESLRTTDEGYDLEIRDDSGDQMIVLPFRYGAGIMLAALTGDEELLQRISEAAKEALESDRWTHDQATSLVATIGIAAVELGDAETALDTYRTLEAEGVVWAIGLGNLDTLKGRLAATLGKTTAAIEHFEAAIAFSQTAGYRTELAWTDYYYADLLIERADPADQSKITELQDEAIAIAQELGMKPLMERVLAQREILKA